MYNIFKYFGIVLLAGCFFFGILYFWSDVLKPDLVEEPVRYSLETIEYTQKLRNVSFTEDELFKIQQDVDYNEGEFAPWYPKFESPILAELVSEGALPSVIERVGSEPLVLKGVDSNGVYGGTLFQVVGSPHAAEHVGYFFAGSLLVRWSPFGYPIVPHIAKGWESSPDKKEWTFYLRRGMKWSDGHPFTADDILYRWYQEGNPKLYGDLPHWMKIKGKPGEVLKIDDYTVKFIFPHSYGAFLEGLAKFVDFCSPRHYLEKYHPVLGDDNLIEATLRKKRLPSRTSLYASLKLWNNPEHPRLNPWVYRTFKANPPQTFVRNPYYFAVDTEGNQLPYVDQIFTEVKNFKFVPIAISNGLATFKIMGGIDFYYTLLMSQREINNYEVYHWFPASRSRFLIHPNINYLVDHSDPITQMKHDLLNNKRFRQALSLAINRRQIIDIVFNGVGEPAQLSPGKESFFHHEKLYRSFTEYSPEKANVLLDEIGLTQRDSKGYRTFKDGTDMVWHLTVPQGELDGPGDLIVDDWNKVGIHTIQERPANSIFHLQQTTRKIEFSIWPGDAEYIPVIVPERLAGLSVFQAYGYYLWFMGGGLYGNPKATEFGGIEPPVGSPIRQAMKLVDESYSAINREEQLLIFNKLFDIAAENVWSINIATSPPFPVVVKDGFKNVPTNAAYSGIFLTPSNAGLETYYFETPYNTSGAIAKIKEEMIKITPASEGFGQDDPTSRSYKRLAWLIKKMFLGVAVCGIIMVGIRHPYIGKRLLIMGPTLLIISIISFTIIQLPPGNYLETKILELRLKGGPLNLEEINKLRETFHLDKSITERYIRWLGLKWFTSFDKKDQGLLQGHLGLSMENLSTVNEMVGDRILLTFFISLGTILFTWAVALPIGIYSAVRQYTFGDYIFTLVGFIGMSIPSFLLALLLLYWSSKYLGINMSGLFSPDYAIQPEWTKGKIIDLLKHIWVPIVVLGVTGTAGMIRIMRANLLDELRKPYVVTGMAKGVRPFKLLMKYPVRLALNPFISGIGAIFPQLVSGGAIVAMVLSLPTVGPLMLDALMKEDMYLAGSMLMVLSLLGILGTLVSDLLLIWLDPRIRMEGGVR